MKAQYQNESFTQQQKALHRNCFSGVLLILFLFAINTHLTYCASRKWSSYSDSITDNQTTNKPNVDEIIFDGQQRQQNNNKYPHRQTNKQTKNGKTNKSEHATTTMINFQ